MLSSGLSHGFFWSVTFATVRTNLRTKGFFPSPRESSVVLHGWHLLPEEDVPEKQPTRIDQKGYEWVNQRAVQIVVQDSLWDDWKVEHPTVVEADGHFLQLLEKKDRKEKRAGRAEDDHGDGCGNPERGRRREEWGLTRKWKNRHTSQEVCITSVRGVWRRLPPAPGWEPGWSPVRSWWGRCSPAEQPGRARPPASAPSSPAPCPHLSAAFEKQHNLQVTLQHYND